MLSSIEAIVEKDGRIRPLEYVPVREGTHAIVTFLTEPEESALNDTSFLS